MGRFNKVNPRFEAHLDISLAFSVCEVSWELGLSQCVQYVLVRHQSLPPAVFVDMASSRLRPETRALLWRPAKEITSIELTPEFAGCRTVVCSSTQFRVSSQTRLELMA